MLTTEERIFVCLQYHTTKSVILVQRKWKKEKDGAPPSYKTITSIYQKFLETGSVRDSQRSGPPCSIIPKDVVQHFSDYPQTSLRRASDVLDISISRISNILNQDGCRPYRLRLIQQLFEEDFAARMIMCTELLARHENDPNFMNNVFWSDEATFHVSGVVNRHNCIIWAHENPGNTVEIPRISPKVNVWIAMSSKKLIGPYFFESNTVKSENYLEMLKDYFVPTLKRHRIMRKSFFQQDGAPPHWSMAVRQFLNETFPQRWIGRGGSISWAPRSPDLTPLDFFLWGYLKNIVYGYHISNIDELKKRIVDACREINQSMLSRVVQNCISPFMLCRDNNGHHFEHTL